MKTRKLYIIGIVLSVATILSGCAADSSSEDLPRTARELKMVLCSKNYTDVTPVATRTLPTGYVSYEELSPKMPMESTMIRAFVTKGSNIDFQGDFVYTIAGNPPQAVWTSKVPVDDGDYYIYGFMPSSELSRVNMVPLNNDYSQGAVMNISGLPALTPNDPCVIVAVKGSNQYAKPITHEDINIQLGNFKFNAGAEGEYIYLLLDHLYAALDFTLCIDYDYNQLRTIKLTKLELKAQNVSAYGLTATLTQGNSTAPLTISEASATDGEGTYQTIYEGDELQLKDRTQENYLFHFMACVAPTATNTVYMLRTTYNVYDSKRNLIRKDCQAENKLTLSFEKHQGKTSLDVGEKYTFNLTVNPTYLYVLSEPDLDNPSLKVN